MHKFISKIRLGMLINVMLIKKKTCTGSENLKIYFMTVTIMF